MARNRVDERQLRNRNQLAKSDDSVKTSDSQNCGNCREKVKTNQRALKCDLCEKWYHIICEGIKLTTPQYNKIDELADTVQWLCRECKLLQMNTYREINELKNKNKDLRMKIEI